MNCRVKVIIDPEKEARVKCKLRLETGRHEVILYSRREEDVPRQIASLGPVLTFQAVEPAAHDPHASAWWVALTGEPAPLSPTVRQTLPDGQAGEPCSAGSASSADAAERTDAERGEAASSAPKQSKAAKKAALLEDPQFQRQLQTLREYTAAHGAHPDFASRKPAGMVKIRNYMASTLNEANLTMERALKLAECLNKE